MKRKALQVIQDNRQRMCNQEEENIETVKKILEAGFQNLLIFLVILAVIDHHCHHCLPDSVKSSLSCISKDHRSIQFLQVVVIVIVTGVCYCYFHRCMLKSLIGQEETDLRQEKLNLEIMKKRKYLVHLLFEIYFVACYVFSICFQLIIKGILPKIYEYVVLGIHCVQCTWFIYSNGSTSPNSNSS